MPLAPARPSAWASSVTRSAWIGCDLTAAGLDARVRAHLGRPRHIVKGATYHRLRFEQVDGEYHATVVLDV